jgi:hypothetical protein
MGHLFGHNSMKEKTSFATTIVDMQWLENVKNKPIAKNNHGSSVNSTQPNELAIDVIDIQKPNTPSQRFLIKFNKDLRTLKMNEMLNYHEWEEGKNLCMCQ